jgi:hypothetical protein
MSQDDFTTGELFHLEAEQRRHLLMATGLTKSSAELRQVINNNPEEYLEILSVGISAFEHYENLLGLVVSSLARLNYIAEEYGNEPSDILRRIIGRAIDNSGRLDS